MLSRGEVSRQFGIDETTLRFYERKGIIVPEYEEGAPNNRRAFTNETLEELHRLEILKAYGFKLSEIKQILDGECDLVDALNAKLEELLREQNRIRNLILFLKFLSITDSDLINGLEFGPEDIDVLADTVRDTDIYKDAINRIRSYSDEDLSEIFAELDVIVQDFVTSDPELEFSGIERAIGRFFQWWNAYLAPVEDGGYLGFWAIFEDDSVVVREVEAVGGETSSSSLQMHAYYVWMKQLMLEGDELLRSVAKSANTDVVAAMEGASELVRFICERMGIGVSAETAVYVIDCMRNILEDDELPEYLGIAGKVSFGLSDLDRVREVVDLLSDEEDEEG